MDFDEFCSRGGLYLGLGLPFTAAETRSSTTAPAASAGLHQIKLMMMINKDHHHHQLAKGFIDFGDDEPSLTLSLSGDHHHHHHVDTTDLCRHDNTAAAAASSFSNNNNVSVKRERDVAVSDDVDTTAERVFSRASCDEDEDGSNSSKKKLRLTKTQSAFLEESFKLHTTLNPKQKQDLARELKLRPRQVEVWFQNRRARTKLKQTEVDCEYLKKWCETLTDENRSLQKEVQELKALQKVAAPPLYMQLPAATLSICPSCCQRIIPTHHDHLLDENINNNNNNNIKPHHHLFSPFTNPSAAC